MHSECKHRIPLGHPPRSCDLECSTSWTGRPTGGAGRQPIDPEGLLELGLGLEVCPPPDDGFFVGGADVVRLGVDVGVGVDVGEGVDAGVGVRVGVGVGLGVADAVEMTAVAVSPRSPVQRTEAGVTPVGTTNAHV